MEISGAARHSREDELVSSPSRIFKMREGESRKPVLMPAPFSRKTLRALSGFVIPGLVAAFSCLLWPAEQNSPRLRPFLLPVQAAEWYGYDTFFNWRGPQDKEIDKRIMVVGYDYNTVGALVKGEKHPWPPARKFHAQVLRNLINDGAKVVAFDILMDNASSFGADDDRAMDKALDYAGEKAVMACRIERADTENRKSLVTPYHDDALGIDFERKARTAFVDVNVDSDNVMRRISPLQKFQGEWLASLAAESYLSLTNQHVENSRLTPNFVYIANNPVPRTGQTILDPTDPENIMATAYMDFPAGLTTFQIERYENVYDGTFPKGTFKGKCVFVGVTGVEITRREQDYFRTAYSHFTPERVGGQTTRDVYGVVVQAQMLNALIKSGFIYQAQRWQTFCLVFIWSLAGTWGIRTFLNFRGPLLLFGSLIGYVLACFALFMYFSLYVPWVLPGVLMASSAAAVAFFERGHMKKMWSGYVSPAYMEVMLREGFEAKPLRYNATVIFGDIRGFTSFSEKHPPEKVVRLLDKHLEKFVRIVYELEGTVDKFLGDGIMIVFGAPKPQEDAAYRAVKAAWLMREAANIPVIDELDGSVYPLATGFGVTTGPLVAGHVGSDQLSSYTLIGDTVNLSARLQAVTGQPDVIIDQATLDQVAAHVDVEDLGFQNIKGKEQDVACFKVIAWRD